MWTRALTVEEVADVMFKAPAYLPATQVVAPTSNQTDTTTGRVLRGKFNEKVCSNGATDGSLSIVGLGGSAKYIYNGVNKSNDQFITEDCMIPLDTYRVVFGFESTIGNQRH